MIPATLYDTKPCDRGHMLQAAETPTGIARVTVANLTAFHHGSLFLEDTTL